MQKRRFLKAEWRNLLMLNYEVDPEILKPYLPFATVIDQWQEKTLVSMVGFMFEETAVLGMKWPGHVNFEEVNLRFYVRHFDGREWKRGAVFISEIVPKPLIALIANNLYKEHYRALPMRHNFSRVDNEHSLFLYEWKLNGTWNKLGAIVSHRFEEIKPGSAEEFIFEHYWGYNSLGDGKTMEYEVEHAAWETAAVKHPVLEADIAGLYGDAFVPWLEAKPYSAFFAKGSGIKVRAGRRITGPVLMG